MNIADLQKAKDKFPTKNLIVPRECEGNDGTKHHLNEGIYERQLADILAWKQDFDEFFSLFKVEYDGQLHVPRFSICMSSEDYDRLVHVSRKHLEDKVVEYKNVIELGKAEGIDFAFLKGALSVWEELLETSEHHFLTVSEAREKLKEAP